MGIRAQRTPNTNLVTIFHDSDDYEVIKMSMEDLTTNKKFELPISESLISTRVNSGNGFNVSLDFIPDYAGGPVKLIFGLLNNEGTAIDYATI